MRFTVGSNMAGAAELQDRTRPSLTTRWAGLGAGVAVDGTRAMEVSMTGGHCIIRLIATSPHRTKRPVVVVTKGGQHWARPPRARNANALPEEYGWRGYALDPLQ
jgi:hypothetical protein